jgi:hypothetical protein
MIVRLGQPRAVVLSIFLWVCRNGRRDAGCVGARTGNAAGGGGRDRVGFGLEVRVTGEVTGRSKQ